MTRSSVKVCRAHQSQSSRTLTTSAAVCEGPFRKETGLLNIQDIERAVEHSLDEEGEETVADDAKKGCVPIRLVNQAKSEWKKFIERMKVSEVVGRKEASGSKVIWTRWVVTNKGSPEKPNIRARWFA